MKKCTKCGIEKPEETFEMQPSRGRRRSECRECRALANKAWLAKRRINPPPQTRETKRCGLCHEIKPASEFSPGNPGNLANRCRACVNKVKQAKRQEQRQNDPNGRFYRPFMNEEGVMIRRCARCHVEKPASEFYGKHCWCKDCDKAFRKSNYEANPEKYREIAREYARKHPEEHRARYYRWHVDNSARRLHYYRQYNETHSARRRAYDRMRHKKETPEYRHLWYERRLARDPNFAKAYRERMGPSLYDWRKAHPEKHTDNQNRRRARELNAPRIEKIDRRVLIERDKWTCYLCMQICTPQNVTLDHIIPLFHGGCHTADNLRVACRSCNCSKGAKLLHEFLK